MTNIIVMFGGSLFFTVLFSIWIFDRHQDNLKRSWISSNGITYFKKDAGWRNWNFNDQQFGLDILYEQARQHSFLKNQRSSCMETDIGFLLTLPFVQTLQVSPRFHQYPKNEFYCTSETLTFARQMLKEKAPEKQNAITDSFFFVLERKQKIDRVQMSKDWRSGITVSSSLRQKAEYQAEGFFHVSLICEPRKKRYILGLRNTPNKSWVGHERTYLRYRKGACLDPRHQEGLSTLLEQIYLKSSGYLDHK